MLKAIRTKNRQRTNNRIEWIALLCAFLLLVALIAIPTVSALRKSAQSEDELRGIEGSGDAVVDHIMGPTVDQKGELHATRIILSFRGSTYAVQTFADDAFQLRAGENVRITFHTGKNGHTYIRTVASFPVVQD